MGSFWNKFFGKKSKPVEKKENMVRTPECNEIKVLSNEIEDLLAGKHYVAKSEYAFLVSKYQKVIDYFKVLESSQMLESFCEKNCIDINSIRQTINSFENINEIVEQANDRYIKNALIQEKDYLDKILYDVDPIIKLDEDQRKVILTDEDNCLVIVGAGAGKTTTVAAKVKYLVEKKNIDPKDILVISFTNKAVGELREKINKELHID